VTLQDIEVQKENTTRRLELRMKGFNIPKIVSHLHYTAWPDHGMKNETSHSFID
jgi:hypothetical protein